MRKPYYSLESLAPDSSVGYLLKRCGVLMTQTAERRFDSMPITFSQWMVLAHLGQHEHVSATQLSAFLGQDMGALTRVVDELERLGFARRERSQRDRRAVEIAITAAGRREVPVGKRAVLELLNRLVEPFTDREVDTLVALLQRLHAHLQEGLAPAVPVPAPERRRARRKSANGGDA